VSLPVEPNDVIGQVPGRRQHDDRSVAEIEPRRAPRPSSTSKNAATAS
jgi:hypothetical protein